ncbi:MAG: bifunctional DNA-formamidopyrimidine glycosylase/DNA-(apurinic or apyrimidinic site) lyase [Gemmatimonadetes bacterium]|nr:bifunctional DNA-formamidopyrimidine glycosylase/DNA-(apurinic or apyrimidinic site) lyase [Gemmatimonadota bacterium]
MPELPEVEAASRIARRAVRGETIAEVEVLHPAQRRSLPRRAAQALAGDRVTRVARRAKYQVLHLASGRSLVVHFRMAGDWGVTSPGESLPRHSRVALRFTSGRALVLVDPRALCTVTVVEAGDRPLPELGPEADRPSFSAAHLGRALRDRATAIKPLLLDQSIVAGIGNIYASEALWRARLDPRRPGRDVQPAEVKRVVAAVHRVMREALAHPERYYQDGEDGLRFRVYDREGQPCRRCRGPIQRITQAGRSTYWCPACQR